MRKAIAAEEGKVQGLELSSAAAAQKAHTAMEEAKVAQLTAFGAGILAQFALILIRLNAAADSPAKALVLVADVSSVILALQAIVNQIETDLAASDRDASTKREELADAPRPAALDAQAHARKARDILAAMERASRLQSVAERRQVAKELLLAPTPARPPLGRTRLTSHATAAAAASWPSRLTSLRAATTRLGGTAKAPDVAPFRAKVDADLAAQFRGRSPTEAARIRDGLLAETRRRYASDPKTLQGVERLVTDAARIR